MIRARFKVDHEDYRPINWPPPGPYWCTGYDSEDTPILVAYADTEDQIREFWPEAKDIESEQRDSYTFTDRFPQPKWWSNPDAVSSALIGNQEHNMDELDDSAFTDDEAADWIEDQLEEDLEVWLCTQLAQ